MRNALGMHNAYPPTNIHYTIIINYSLVAAVNVVNPFFLVFVTSLFFPHTISNQ